MRRFAWWHGSIAISLTKTRWTRELLGSVRVSMVMALSAGTELPHRLPRTQFEIGGAAVRDYEITQPFAREMPRASEVQLRQISVTLFEAFDRVARSLVLLDEIVLNACG